MFLHVGSVKSIRKKDIIGIFDMDNATLSKITQKYLTNKERAGLCEEASFGEIPKSFVLYKDNGDYKICFSQFSSMALRGRM